MTFKSGNKYGELTRGRKNKNIYRRVDFMKQFRQGDILLKEIIKIPNNLTEKDKVLALGEMTNHSHRFESPNVKVMIDNKGNQFAKVMQESELIHEEHENIKIPIGNYAVIQQREFDILKGVRQVSD